jgi:hypothetical protein
MRGDGKAKWETVWFKVLLDLRNDTLFYSTFQNAFSQVFNPAQQVASLVLKTSSICSDMINKAQQGNGKMQWTDLTPDTLEMASAYDKHDKLYGEEEGERDDNAGEDEEVEAANDALRVRKMGGIPLNMLQIGDFLKRIDYPGQIRARVSGKAQMLTLRIFRFAPPRTMPRHLAPYGGRPSKQLAEWVLQESARFEVSRCFRILIPFSFISGLHLYKNSFNPTPILTQGRLCFFFKIISFGMVIFYY